MTDLFEPFKVKLDASRRNVLNRLLEVARHNAEQSEPPMQHVLVIGPPGSGKTYLLDLFANELKTSRFAEQIVVERTSTLALQSAAPESLLQWMTEAVKGVTADPATFPWRGGDEAAWEEAIVELDKALDKRFGAGRGLAVLILDDLEYTLARVFGGRGAEFRLRRLLQEHPRLMIVAATRDRRIQSDYDRPLFQIFEQIDLAPLDLLQTLGLDETNGLKPYQRDYFHAALRLLGPGQPRRMRNAASLAHLAKSARELFVSLMDIETPAFRQTVEHLAIRPARLLDALLVGGEPARPAALAERLATLQNDIAPTLRDLLSSDIIQRRPGSSGKMTYYEAQDRLFANWYVARRRPGTPVGIECADILGHALTVRAGNRMTSVYSEASDMFAEAIGAGSRAKAFKILMTAIDWETPAAADPKNNERRCAAMVELISKPASLELLADLASSLADGVETRSFASILDAAMVMRFQDWRLEGQLKRPINLRKDNAPNPDAETTILAIRDEETTENA